MLLLYTFTSMDTGHLYYVFYDYRVVKYLQDNERRK